MGILVFLFPTLREIGEKEASQTRARLSLCEAEGDRRERAGRGWGAVPVRSSPRLDPRRAWRLDCAVGSSPVLGRLATLATDQHTNLEPSGA